MQVDDGLATFGGEGGGAVFLVVHEEILGEDCRAERVLENVKRGLDVRITVGIIPAELMAGEVFVFISSAPLEFRHKVRFLRLPLRQGQGQSRSGPLDKGVRNLFLQRNS